MRKLLTAPGHMVSNILVFERCVLKGLYYFSLKQVNNGKCITAVRGILGY